MKPTNKTRYLSIDFGLKRIGLAISDESHLIASPLTIIQAEKKTELTIKKILDLLNDHQKNYSYTLASIIIGMPLMMSGKVGFLADEVNHFIDEFKKQSTIPIVPWDERLTSVQAERSMREGGMTRRKRAKVVDSVAAIIILQNYLDHLRFQKDFNAPL